MRAVRRVAEVSEQSPQKVDFPVNVADKIHRAIEQAAN
jgi:hypothetical protein